MPWKKANKELIDLLEKSMKECQCDRKAMFGSPTFFINNNMFAGVHEDTVILRLSEDDRKEIFSLYKEVTPFTPMGGHVMKEFAALPEKTAHQPGVFQHWLKKSTSYTRSLPYKEPRSSTKKKSS